MEGSTKKGIYMICDKEGFITDILYNDMGLISSRNLPFKFSEIISEGSLQKAAKFWKKISENEHAFNYELYINIANGREPLKFTASVYNDIVWVIAVTRNEITDQMLDEMMMINNEQQNLIRQSEKRISKYKGKEPQPGDELYDEISRINNELVNTQRKLVKKNKEIERLNEKLQESNQKLERFSYDVSHDLKEPLRMVRSFLQLLEKKYGDVLDDKAREYIGFAVDGADRMKELISDLLGYTRIGRDEKSFDLVDLNEVLESVHTLNKSWIIETETQIKANDLPEVKCQKVLIKQLFNNLISNSIKYCGVDRAPVIQIDAEEKENHWLFSITDNGQGIPHSMHTTIFDLFKRGTGKDDNSGSGMGLAICKKIVEEHGGEIWVESEPGKGSTFCFTITKQPV